MFNLDEKREYIINAYIDIFGEEYRDQITSRLGNANIIYYLTEDNCNNYIRGLRTIKEQELMIQYYQSIGNHSLDKYSVKNYIEGTTEDEDGIVWEFYDDIENMPPIPNEIQEEINRILNEYVEELQSSKSYITDNTELLENYNKAFTQKMREVLKLNLPENFADIRDIDMINAFSKDNERTVQDSIFGQSTIEDSILNNKLKYFQNLRMIKQDVDVTTLKYSTKTAILDKLMENNAIRALVPTESQIEKIRALQFGYLTDYNYEALINREDIKDNSELLEIIQSNKDKVSAAMASNRICELIGENNKKVVLFTLLKNAYGENTHNYLHELAHIATTNEDGIVGIENTNTITNNVEAEENPGKRKYEVLNEILIDYYSEQAMQRLVENGIYLIEDQDTTYTHDQHHNTSIELRNLVVPLISLCDKEIKEALITGSQEPIRNAIGNENFERLNNLINKTYYNQYRMDIDDETFDNNKAEGLIEEAEIYNDITEYRNKKNPTTK